MFFLEDRKYDNVGSSIAIIAGIIGVAGALVNNLWLNPLLARQIWMCSNPFLLIWAWGLRKHWWQDGLGPDALVGMYSIYTVTGAFSLGII